MTTATAVMEISFKPPKHHFLQGVEGIVLAVLRHASDQITGKVATTPPEHQDAIDFIFTKQLDRFVNFYEVFLHKIDPQRFRKAILTECRERREAMEGNRCEDCMHCLIKNGLCKCRYGQFYKVEKDELEYITRGFAPGCNFFEDMSD